jgi:hypothetical protein
MKFFIFNLAVLSSLAYLIWGNGNNSWNQISKLEVQKSVVRPIKSALKNVKEATKEKLKSLKTTQSPDKDNLENFNKQKRKAAEAVSKKTPLSMPIAKKERNIEEVVINVPMRPIPVMLAPAGIPERSKKTKQLPINNTKIIRQESGTKFMTATERRRELNKLAREMELLFVDKLKM